MKDMNFKNWTENFSQSVLSSVMDTGDNHAERFLNKKLRQSVHSFDEASEKIFISESSHEYYQRLCVILEEAKNCVYWFERSLEYERVNLNNSNLIINQGKCMIEVLEATLRVIKYQEN